VTPPPARFYVSGKARRVLRLVVFVNLLGGVFIKELSGTKYEGRSQQETFHTTQGKEAKAMTLKEYVAAVVSAHAYFNSQSRAFRALGDNVILVHDGARVHHKKKIANAPWTPVTQPPHSPDMMPLDYGIFGFTKIRLQRAVLRSDRWEHKVAMFKQFIMEAPVGPTINEFKKRMKACIAFGGWHIERQSHTE
jgi:hypothetical protein